ncbi:MAG: DUF1540 domain-containing protein [Christensenellales bacterium]
MIGRGTQLIKCTVDSCRYHDRGDKCQLSSIHVSPISGDAQTSEDSMCQSFLRKGYK